jgi:tRNA1(Val) A37 N6-methylase TrmN6
MSGAIEKMKLAIEATGKPAHEINLVDAGCGPGLILLLASIVCGVDRPLGLEIQDEYIYMARKLSQGDHFEVIKADILKYEDWNKHDIIYYYCPFVDEKKEEEFEHRVEDRAKVGSVMITNNKRSSRFTKQNGRFKVISYDVIKKIAK